jgi:anaerobic magnesium-protoporphyrin IX monomethyl ester cyclase
MSAWLAAMDSPAPDFSAIPGLYVRSSDGRIRAPLPPVLRAVDTLPHPRPYTWMDFRPYARRGATAGIQTKRGCVFHCTYCAYSIIEGCAHRLREPGDVADEMEGWLAAARPGTFEFVDRVFNAPEDHAAGVCETILRRGLKTRLTTMGFNPGPVSAGLINVMKEAGFRDLMCSPDSASPVMLERLKKNFTVAQLASASDLLRRAGIRVFWFFTLGGPGETRETVQETLDFCRRFTSPEDLLLFSIGFRVSPNTPLALEAREEGAIAGGEDLLMPAFYCSPRTSPLEIMTQIHQSALTHSNFITLYDFEIPSVIQGVFKSLVPFYKPRNDSFAIPSLNRGLNRLGILPRIHARQRKRMQRPQ